MHRVVAAVESGILPGPGIVAVSGGADSVALALALRELQVPITVAHVNHQLRGVESDADEAFVAGLAQTWNCGFASTRISLPSVGLEAAAREARYAWLQTLPGSWIATGHNADDQAETILFRLIRGTGLRGLAAMQPVTYFAADAKPIVRPLLSVSRPDIFHYLQNHPYREDRSNTDPRFSRNRLRHEVLPRLEAINSDVRRHLVQLAEQAQEANAIVETLAWERLARWEKPRAGACVVLLPETGAPALVARTLFRLLWQREGWPLDRMSYDHWQRLALGIPGDYPGGVQVRRRDALMQLERLL